MRLTRMALMVGGLVALAGGCTKATGGGQSVRVGVSAASTASAATQGSGSTVAIDGGNGLSIDRVRMVVRRVELEAPEGSVCTPASSGSDDDASNDGGGADTSATATTSGDSGSGSDDGGDDAGECEFGGGPFLVDLSGSGLDTGIHWVATIDVPAGTYAESKIVINTIPAGKAGSDAGLEAMAAAHASILVDGTLNESPFTFSTPFEVQQQREGAIVIDPATSNNLTLDVDPSGWFRAADGSLLSPTDATATGAILANIRASIRILHDDDRDGKDDDHPTP